VCKSSHGSFCAFKTGSIFGKCLGLVGISAVKPTRSICPVVLMFSRNGIDCSDSHSPDKSLRVVRSIESRLSHLAHGPDFVASLLQGIVFSRF
jgi:hypothetical protein